MGKCVIRHSSHPNTDTVIDADTLERWIDMVRAADKGDKDAIELLPKDSVYIAERLAELIGYRPDDTFGGRLPE